MAMSDFSWTQSSWDKFINNSSTFSSTFLLLSLLLPLMLMLLLLFVCDLCIKLASQCGQVCPPSFCPGEAIVMITSHIK